MTFEHHTSKPDSDGRQPSIEKQLHAHAEHDNDQSLLQRGLSFIWDGGSAQSLKDLKALKAQIDSAQKSGDQSQLATLERQAKQAVAHDKQSLRTADKYLGYAAGGIELGCMAFSRGLLGSTVGWGGTLSSYAADSMKVGSSWHDRAVEGVLGAGKGAAMRGLFQLQPSNNWMRAGQGMLAGYTSRTGDLLGDRKLYGDGSLSAIGNGIGSALAQSFDLRAMGLDAGAFVGGHMLFRGAAPLLSEKLADSTVAKGMLAGSTFGFTSGAGQEFFRQQKNGESFSLGNIVEGGLIQGAIGSLAVAPGSLHAAYGQARPMSADKAAKTEKPNAGEAGAEASSTVPMSPEFRVSGGTEQLQELVAARRLNKAEPNAALLDVQQVLSGGQLGQPQRLLVQHVATAEDAAAANNFIKANPDVLLANCPESLTDAAAKAHVLPQAEQLQLHLQENPDGNRIRFTAGDTKIPGYEQVGMLGEQNGVAAQRKLLSWMLAEPVPNEKDVPALVLRRQAQAQMKRENWKLFATESGSAADSAGQDYILLNADGRYKFFDTTLDYRSKKDVSPLRKDGIVYIRAEEDALTRMRTNNPDWNSKENFARMILDGMQGDTVLNTKDVPLADPKTSRTPQDLQQKISSYHSSLLDYGNRLNNLAATAEDSSDIARYDAHSKLIKQYAQDVATAGRFAQTQVRQVMDQGHPERMKIFQANIAQIAQDVLYYSAKSAPPTRPTEQNNHSNGLTYNSQYDQLLIRLPSGTVKLQGVGAAVRNLIERAVLANPPSNMETKRWMLSESGQRTVLNRVINRLGEALPTDLEKPPVRINASSTPPMNNQANRPSDAGATRFSDTAANRSPDAGPNPSAKAGPSRRAQRWYPGTPSTQS